MKKSKLFVSVLIVLCLLSSFTAMGAESIIPSNALSSKTEFDKYWSNTDGSSVSATFADNVVTFGNLATVANGWGGACKPKANIQYDSYVVEMDMKIKGSTSDADVGMVGFVVNLPSDFASLNSPALSESCQAVRIMLRNYSHSNVQVVSFGNHTGTAGDFVPVASTAGGADLYFTYADKASAEDWIHVRIEVEAGRVAITLDNDANKTAVYQNAAWTSLNGGFSFWTACDGYLNVKNLTIVDASAPVATPSATPSEEPTVAPSATPSEEPTVVPSATPEQQEPNQPTGDASMIVLAVVAVVCGGALVVLYKKKSCHTA